MNTVAAGDSLSLPLFSIPTPLRSVVQRVPKCVITKERGCGGKEVSVVVVDRERGGDEECREEEIAVGRFLRRERVVWGKGRERMEIIIRRLTKIGKLLIIDRLSLLFRVKIDSTGTHVRLKTLKDSTTTVCVCGPECMKI